MLDECGLSGATVPRIAAAADVAPATIYRRFADKDALLRTAFIHILRQANEGNRLYLPMIITGDTLDEAAERLMLTQLKQYRTRPGLMLALRRFLKADSDPDFARQAQELMQDNLRLVVEGLLRYRKQISHPQPERAVRIAVLSAIGALEMSALEHEPLWEAVAPISDEELAHELAQALTAYLRSQA